MGMELASDAMAQAIIVSEAEKKGNISTHHEHANCANCGTSLQGAYCHACGQSSHIHRSLLHLIEELLHGLFHFETKAWRTIPQLIYAPGRLTRNYIEGQRTRYVSPLALFLFLIFLMFFVFSFTTSTPFNSISDHPKTREGISNALKKSTDKLTALQSQRGKMAITGSKLEDLDEDIAEAKLEISALEKSLALFNEKVPPTTKGQASAASSASVEDDYSGINEAAKKIDQKLNEKSNISTYPAIEKKVRHALKTPELTIYKIKSNASKLSFLLMPISLPFLWLMFIFKRRYGMFDHAVFSLYSLCFMSLLLMSGAILNYFDFTITALLLIVFVPPVHMFLQLRTAYQLGIFASLWRMLALLFVATCSLCIYVFLIIGLST